MHAGERAMAMAGLATLAAASQLAVPRLGALCAGSVAAAAAAAAAAAGASVLGPAAVDVLLQFPARCRRCRRIRIRAKAETTSARVCGALCMLAPSTGRDVRTYPHSLIDPWIARSLDRWNYSLLVLFDQSCHANAITWGTHIFIIYKICVSSRVCLC